MRDNYLKNELRLQHLMTEALLDFQANPNELTPRAIAYMEALKNALKRFCDLHLIVIKGIIEEIHDEDGIPRSLKPEAIYALHPQMQEIIRERQEMLHLINWFLGVEN